MIDLEKLRDVYKERFGEPERVEHVEVPEREISLHEALTLSDDQIDEVAQTVRWDPRAWLLHFHRKDAQALGPLVYASFGASLQPPGHELFLTATVRWFGLERLIKRIFRAGVGDLAPLSILPCNIPATPFSAVLALPDEDGSFPLPGGRRALRIVPISPAEEQLAARDPQKLLALLRDAGAFVADPMRAPVVAGTRDQGRRANAGLLLWGMRSALHADQDNVAHILGLGLAPEGQAPPDDPFLAASRATLAHFEAAAAAILGAPDAPEIADESTRESRLLGILGDILSGSVDPYFDQLPPDLLPLSRAFMLLVLLAHPLVQPVLYEAATGEGLEPPNERGSQVAETRRVVERSVSAIGRLFRTVPRRELVALARRTLAETHGAYDPAQGVPWEVRAWADVAPPLCLAATPPPEEQGAAAAQALRASVERAAHLDTVLAAASGTARERFEKVASSMAEGFLLDVQRALRGE